MPRLPLAILVVVVLAIPACSTTTSPGPSTSTTATTTSAPPQAHGVYEQCLTQHGVPSQPQGPLPGPPADEAPTPIAPPPPGVDQATWDNAQQACASLRPTAPPIGP